MRFINRSNLGRAALYVALVALGGAALATTGLLADAAGLREAPSAARTQVAEAVGSAPIKPLLPLVSAAEVDALLLSPEPTIRVAPLPKSPAQEMPAPPDLTGTLSRPVTPLRTRHVQEPRAADPARSGYPTLHIANIKRALKLRPEQEPYWLPVEAVLHDIERQQRLAAGREPYVRPTATRPLSTAIDPEILQRLTSAAFPLIMSLDEAQKREVRALAHSMGLESVASAI